MKWVSLAILLIAIGYGGLYFRPLSMKTATWRLRLSLMHWKLIFGMCVLGEKAGIGPFYNHLRAFTRPLMNLLKNTTDVTVYNVELAGVRTVIYKSSHAKDNDPTRPALLYFHGGGWVLGVPEMYQTFFQELVRQLDIVIVAVDYEKAPEHLYPKAFDTCLKAVTILHNRAAHFGIDAKRIAVGGDSAGGNLAAAVISHLHSGVVPNEKARVARLLLFYPVLQGLDFKLPSYISNKDEEMLQRDFMIRFWQIYIQGSESYTQQMAANNHSSPTVRKRAREFIWNYLPGNPQPSDDDDSKGDPEAIQALQSATIDSLTSPILFPDSVLKKLPPVYIVTCEYDILRDEALAYAIRLHKMNHPVKHEHYLAYHALLSFYQFGITEAKIMVEDVIMYLKDNL